MRKIVLLSALLATAVMTPALAAGLSQADAKAVIEKRSGNSDQNFTFRSIQIAGARAASPGEIGHMGLPPGVTVTPVKADYTEVTGGNLGRDHIQMFLFYKDDFGAWSAQPMASPANVTSDLKKVR
jgi:hypothetical protein